MIGKIVSSGLLESRASHVIVFFPLLLRRIRTSIFFLSILTLYLLEVCLIFVYSRLPVYVHAGYFSVFVFNS